MQLPSVSALLLGTVISISSLTPVQGQDDPGTTYPQPAFTADQFVDFIGISGDPFQKYIDSGPFKGAGSKFSPDLLYDLGVRHYRMCLKNELSRPDTAENVRDAYAKHGIKPMTLISAGASGSPADVVQRLKDFGGAEVVGDLEGPNEVNNKFPPQDLNLKYAGKTDEIAGAAFMVDYYKALKADPATKDIPFVAYTAIFTDYRLARPCESYDYSNTHSYQGYNVPSSSLLPNFLSTVHLLPVGGVIKPFVPTECGYNVDVDVSNHIAGTGNLQAQATNIPMLLSEYFRHGFMKRAYLFGLPNADGYGLIESDQVTKRPSYYALQSFLSALKDSTWNPATRKWEGGQFTPKALLFTVDGALRTLKSITLQKENGDYSLLIWNELPVWNSEKKQAISNPPAHVTLEFQTPVDASVQVLKQDDSGAFKAAEKLTVDDGKLALSVPAAVIILQLKATPGIPTTVVAAPQNLQGQATEGSVNLSWAPASGSSLDGYFVYRNGWCIGSTTSTSMEDKSPWIRPGLGYTYAVQAFDKNGNMSEKTTEIIQTPAKFPDYVITDFGMDNSDAKPGDQIHFRAKIKNIGEGQSPPNTPISVTFHLDGKIMSWGGTDNLAPGDEREFVDGGGPEPVWTATPGTHLLEAHIDDIDRIVEESDKLNNIQDKTIVVGAPTSGELLGSSQEAPWKVDLTQEGTEDWIHWGLKDAKAVDRKMSVNEISDVTVAGQGFLSWTDGTALRTSWQDGNKTPSMDGTNTGLWFNGVGGAYSFTAPADTTERVLKVYASAIGGATCSLTTTLSDNSAPPYISKTWTGNFGHGDWAAVPGDFSVVYTIRYHAASAGQKLKVDYKLEDEPNRFLAQARLTAVTLSKATGF